MNIAILGGRFDPPHIGHFLIAQQILEKRAEIEQVWFIPAFQHQWKEIVASGEERLAMLKTFESEKIKISDIEIKRGGISYTIDTIKEIKQTQNHKIYWIVGADIIPELNKWEKAEELTNYATFLVFPRDPYHLPTNLPQGFEIVNGENLITISLSSTIIRDRIKKGLPITHLVSPKIEQYILERKLYA